jgi:ribosomal protein S7
MQLKAKENLIWTKKTILEKQLYNKLIGSLIKKGYKITAIKILSQAFLTLKKKTGYSFPFLVWKLFLKLHVTIDVRTVLIRGRSHIVPFKTKPHRKIYLVTKWLTSAILLNKKKGSMVASIVNEFLLIYKNDKSSKAVSARQNNLEKALANRANLHYRW